MVAWHLDRITRTMLDLERLILLAVDRGVGIATATGDIDLTSDAGRMVARILAAVARAEVERKAERQKLGYRQKARSGRPNWGTRPFGFERDGSRREPEAEALAEIYRAVLNGSSLAACARRLNEKSLPTTHGTAWSGHVLRAVLLNERNIAKVTYHGEVVAALESEPIVSEDTFFAVRHLLRDPGRNTGGGGVVQTLLSGIATCGKGDCGRRVKMGWKGRKGEQGSFQRYVCPKGHVSIPVDLADGAIFLRLIGDDIERWGRSLLPAADPAKAAALSEERSALSLRLDEAAAAFAEGAVTMSQLETMTSRMTVRLDELETELAGLGGANDVFPVGVNFEFIGQEFDAMELDRQRAIVRAVYSRVLLLPSGRGRSATSSHVVTVRHDELPSETPKQVENEDRYAPLAREIVRRQPSGVTTLREVALWLRDEGLTHLKPSGLQSRLSSRVAYDRSAGRWILKISTSLN